MRGWDRALVQGDNGPRLADSAGASYGVLGRGPSQFTLTAVPAPGVGSDTVAQALKAEVARIAREGISATELQRVKTQWAAGEIYKRDSVFNQAQELGTYWVNGLDIASGDRLMARLRAVTAEQVRDVAPAPVFRRPAEHGGAGARSLPPHACGPARTAPGDGGAIESAHAQDLCRGAVPPCAVCRRNPAVRLAGAGRDPDPALDARQWRTRLSRREPVHSHARRADRPGRRGRDATPTLQAGLAAAMASQMSAGLAAHDGQPALDENQLSEAWVDLGAQMGAQAGGDRFSVSLRTLTRPRSAGARGGAGGPPAGRSRLARSGLAARPPALAGLSERGRNTARHPTRAGPLRRPCTRDHPYGREVTAATLGAITIEDLRSFYRRHAAACRAQVSLVGAVDRAAAERIVDRLLSVLAPNGCEPLAEVRQVAPLESAVERRLPFDAAQAQVLIGQPGHRRNDPDFFPLFRGQLRSGRRWLRLPPDHRGGARSAA